MSTHTYPLKVERWGEEGELVVSKGHHPPCPFLRRAIRLVAHCYRLGDPPDFWTREEACEMVADLGHDDVEHEWWRHSPSRTMGVGTEWEGMRWFKTVAGPGRGAFPMTGSAAVVTPDFAPPASSRPARLTRSSSAGRPGKVEVSPQASNLRPADYESLTTRPPSSAQCHLGRSGMVRRPPGAALSFAVTRSGMTNGMTNGMTEVRHGYLPSEPVSTAL